jgi:hypothetical protein
VLMKKSILISMVLLSALGCSQESEVNAQLDVGTKNCGITNIESSNSGFWFSCGLGEEDLSSIKNVADITLKKEQLCSVYYSTNGQPEQFRCQDRPVEFDEFFAKGLTFHGDWVCTGLDSLGGYDNTKLSDLTFNENGTFKVEILATLNSGSVWHIKDSTLKGTYTVDSVNKIRLAPETLGNDLINMANLTLKDAPQFMLVNPALLEITSLSDKTLMAGLRSGNRSNRVSCERPKRIIAATE